MNYQITCVCGHRFFITDEQLAGHVTCPTCGRALLPVVTPSAVPVEAAATSAAPMDGKETTEAATATSVEATKRCPFCGEVILAVAKKCKHCGEFLDRAPAGAEAINRPLPPHPVVTPSHPTAPASGEVEPPIFSLSVSQWDNFWKYLICLTLAAGVSFLLIKVPLFRVYAALGVPITLVVMALVAWYYYSATRNSRCVVRPMRIETEVGILSKDVTSLDLFRITDLEFKQKFFERLLGIGTIRVTSNDPDTPELVIYQIPKAKKVFRYLQQQIPIAARQRSAVYFER